MDLLFCGDGYHIESINVTPNTINNLSICVFLNVSCRCLMIEMGKRLSRRRNYLSSFTFLVNESHLILIIQRLVPSMLLYVISASYILLHSSF